MEENPDKAKYEFRNSRNQYFAVFSASLLMISHGCITGWATPALILLRSAETPLESGPLTTEEESWIGSMTSLGGIFGTFISGYAAGLIGCKHTLAFLAIPAISYWLTIYLTKSASLIIIGRFLAGWTGGGLTSISAIYVAEIAEDRIRGKLGSIALVCRNGGMLLAFILGALLDYDLLPYIFVVIPIVYLIKFIILPNTPPYLVRRGKFEEAVSSLNFYKGCSRDSIEDSIAISAELERLKTLAIERRTNRKVHLRDIFERNARKALIIGIILSFLSNLSGVFVLITYAGRIFSSTGTSVDQYTSAIVLGVFHFIGPLFTTQFADKWGRKNLLIISLLGSAVGQTALATFSYLQILDYELSGFGWVPVTSLSFIMFIASVGVAPLSSLCTLEILPRKIRTFGMSLTTITLSLSSFILNRFFPVGSEIIGLYGCLWFMAVTCVFGTLFVIFIMEETNGRDLDVIGVRRPATNKPI